MEKPLGTSHFKRLMEQGGVMIDGTRIRDGKFSIAPGEHTVCVTHNKNKDWMKIEFVKSSQEELKNKAEALLKAEDPNLDISVSFFNEDGTPCTREEFVVAMNEGVEMIVSKRV